MKCKGRRNPSCWFLEMLLLTGPRLGQSFQRVKRKQKPWRKLTVQMLSQKEQGSKPSKEPRAAQLPGHETHVGRKDRWQGAQEAG
jgi:hypothetical protein